ncbi:MAG: hypothetical protein U0894_17325 [Pirellulales bacterium]
MINPQPFDRDELKAKGRRRKDRGMAAALSGKCLLVAKGQLAFLEALLRSPDGTATIDDATDDLSKKFDDDGKWRGSIPRSLATRGIIEKAGYATSCRPSRHACPTTRWRLKDRAKAEAMAKELREAFQAIAASKEPRQRQLDMGGGFDD